MLQDSSRQIEERRWEKEEGSEHPTSNFQRSTLNGQGNRTETARPPYLLPFGNADIPAYTAFLPRTCSIRSNWLYFANRSERLSEPVLI